MTDTPTQPISLATERLAEAARYALLRRLAPAIRHDMAGALQPISMVAVMLEKRLQKPVPDMAVIGKNIHDINTLAREASTACMQLMTWLAPRLDTPQAIGPGVKESIALITTELSFQGVSLVDETTDVTATLPVSVLRGLLIASLLALTDAHPGPATVVIGAEKSATHTVLTLTLTATARADSDDEVMAPTAYRSLDWDDVRAMAAADEAELRLDKGRVTLRFSA